MKRKKFERISMKAQQRRERQLQDQASRTCQKRQYRTKSIARQEAARAKRVALYFYRCPECRFWHLTSRRPREMKG